jgi:demethylmenaquinone methyltransferase/2-methoxy-6-polyprenyl-1,4-benzoquinol methylase
MIEKEKIVPYKTSDASKKDQVAQMFDSISGNYDGLNRIISMGTDISWRKKVLKIVEDANPDNVLDIATGTGDLAILLAETKVTTITGIDISEGMLSVGKEKVTENNLDHKVVLKYGDSENIPYEDNYFDAITVAFGIRNFENLDKGLQEIHRVLKSKGIFVILETSVPEKFPFKQGYNFYTKFILPLIGKMFSKDKVAYQYLSESANNFPYGEKLNNILRKNGFIDVVAMPQTFGVATIYKATKL